MKPKSEFAALVADLRAEMRAEQRRRAAAPLRKATAAAPAMRQRAAADPGAGFRSAMQRMGTTLTKLKAQPTAPPAPAPAPPSPEAMRAHGAAVLEKALALCREGKLGAADVARLHMTRLRLDERLG